MFSVSYETFKAYAIIIKDLKK